MRITRIISLIIGSMAMMAYCRSWQNTDPCPMDIKVTIPNHSDWYSSEEIRAKPRLETMADVHHMLTSCANITSLDLRVTLLGCSSWPDRFSFPFSVAGGERYPPLRTVRLEGYRFDEKIRHSSRPSELFFGKSWFLAVADWIGPGKVKEGDVQRQKTNLDRWLDTMDWAGVEDLALLDPYTNYTLFLDNMPNYLTGLKRLELQGNSCQKSTDFIGRLRQNSLTHLTLTEIWNSTILASITAHHGKSLEHVDIHTQETLHRPSLEFSPTHIQDAFGHMPLLKHLSINLPRPNETWPLETLTAISEIKPLKTLDLWLDIASTCRRQKPDRGPGSSWDEENDTCTGEEQYLKPYLNETTAMEVFKFLRENKVGERLTNVTFRAGDWKRTWDGPLYFPPWIERQKAFVTCNVSTDTGEPRCVVEEGRNYWNRRPYYDMWDTVDSEDYLEALDLPQASEPRQ